MTAVDFLPPPPATRRFGLATLLRWAAGWRELAHNRAEARELAIALSHYEPRLLADMGFDADAVYDAVEWTWHAVPANRRGRPW